METLNRKIQLLEKLQKTEGEAFHYDEQAIFDEYREEETEKSSLTIKILSIVGGFLASLAFLGFLALAGLYDSEVGMLVFGVGFIVGAILINQKYKKLIVDTFSISLYAIGFILLVASFGQWRMDENIIAISVIITALITLYFTQNYMLSFLSGLVVSGGFLSLILMNNAYGVLYIFVAVNALVLLYIFLNEAKLISSHGKLSKLYNPIRVALIVSLLASLFLVGNRHLVKIDHNLFWIASVVLTASILLLVHKILLVLKVETATTKQFFYVLSFLVLLPVFYYPPIAGAFLILLLSFFVNYKTGFVLGVLALIYFVSQYYYDLNFTLLTKSIMLFASGLVFLVLYAVTNKKLS